MSISKKIIHKIIYILLFISIVLWIYRIVPYFSTNIPFWYDPWIYRFMISEYIQNLPNIQFSNLSEYTKSWLEPHLWFLSNIFHLIWYNIDYILTFWVWFFSIITSIFIYINLKNYSKVTAVIWIIIFLISIIEYQAFWWNYYKQILGIIFMLAWSYLIEKKKYVLSLPLIISLFTIHKATWLYFLITFILYKTINFFLNKSKETKDIQIIFTWWIIALTMYIPLFKEQILELLTPLFNTLLKEWNSGTFFSKEDFWKYNFFIVLPSIYWLYYKIKKKNFDIITCGYITWMIWVWFWLFFYSRFYIFFDIFIILNAAYWFWTLYKNKKNTFLILFYIFFICQSLFYYNYLSNNNTPLINTKEFENIQKINTIVPKDSMIMVTHKHYSSWLSWYTNFPVIAPWFLNYDIWGFNQWKTWWHWDWEHKCKMLEGINLKYPQKQTYLWVGSDQPPANIWNWICFNKTSIWWEWFQLYKIILSK